MVFPNVSVGGISLYLTTPTSVVVAVLVGYLALIKDRLKLDKLLIVILFLCVVVVLSALFSWIKGLTPVSYRDLIEVVKYAQYIPYLLAIPFLRKDFSKGFTFSSKIAVIFFITVGLLQVFNIHFLTHLYLGASSAHLYSVLSGYRITITGSDPNIGGAIAAFFAFVSLSFFLFQRKNVFWFASFVLCFLLMLFTQSRTVLVAFAFSFVVFIFFYYRLTPFLKIPLLLILVALGSFIFMGLDLQYIIIGFQIALEGNNNSLNVRLENIAFAYEALKANPLLGIGPSKENLSSIVDSEYALIMQRYGLLGIVAFLILVGLLFKTAIKNKQIIEAKMLLLFMMMVPFIMLTNNVFSGYQLMSIPVLLYMVIKNKRIFNAKKNRTPNLRPPAI